MNVSKREAEAAASRARKAKKINFICDLFKTYVGVYGNTSSGKVRSVDKIVQATQQSRCTIYRILKKYGAIPPEEDGRRSKWAGGISDEIAQAIKMRVLSLHRMCRGIMSIEIIQKTLEEEDLFTSSSTSLYRLLRQLGFDYNRCAAAWTVANEKFFDESITDEQLNYSQGHFSQFSNTNMMEVKHSPSSQMEFRPTANNSLAHDVEDKDLDTLFENGEKSLTSTSDTCDSSAPTMNGVSKHVGLSLDGMEIDLCEDDDGDTNDKTDDVLEDMEIDLPKPVEAESSEAKKENEETEEVKADKAALEVFDIDLDEEAASKVETNGAVESSDTDPSKVRDTGDDLDTLLSKINDLVEDCMEPKAAEEACQAVTADEAVAIPDADIDDAEAPKAAAENDSHSEVELEAESENAEAKQETTETVADETTASPSEEVTSNDLATEEELGVDLDDDDVVCLDSPLPEETQAIDDKATAEETISKTEEAAETVQPAQGEEKEPTTEESKDEELTEKPSETEEKSEDAEKPAEEVDTSELVKSKEATEPTTEAEETTPKEPSAIDDDEIFLIEDDEDDVPMDDASVSPAKPAEEEKSTEEPAEPESENKVEETADELPKTDEEVEKPEVESEVECPQKPVEEKPVVEVDDDIVCLDDSMDETEEKAEESKEKNDNEVNAEPAEGVILPAEAEKSVTSELEKESEKVVAESEKVEEESETVEKESEKVEKESEKVEKEAEKENFKEIIAKPAAEKEGTEAEEMETESIDETKVEKSPPETLEVAAPPATEKDVPAVAEVDDVPPVVMPESTVEKQPEAEKPSPANIVDDIVILDDDDDEAEVTSSTATEKAIEKSTTPDSTDKKSPEEETKPEQASPSDESASLKPSTILSDNSDNARDGVEEKEENAEAKASEEKTPMPSESTTCNSNSSNLLKETAKERDEAPEQPPAKRIRLSQDEASSRHSTASQDDAKSNIVDDDDVMEVISKEDEDSKSLKRVHSTDSISSDFKKPKTEEEPSTKKVELKSFSLYPAPKMQDQPVDLSLDFLRRFKKSIYKMTKTDLEELVLQKIVEAIVHKSEFSEMRELLEKQEKIISGFRTKISELNKQFRDLEMVHNRVLKDLETKNSQFIMPVKITRAVGLQVFFPNKKYDQPLMAQSNTPTQAPAPVQAAKSVTSLNNSLPEKPAVASPVAANVATTPTAVATQATQATPVNNLQQQQQVAAQRRGCVQKLTPMRPDTPRNSPLNRVVATTASPSSSPSTPTGAAKELPPKILNRSVAQKTRIGMPVGANTSPAGTVKTIQAPPLPIEKPKAPVVPQAVTTNKSPLNRWAPPKGPTESHTVAQPVPQSVSIPNTPISTGTPRPPAKSVIDLTDEDDVVPAPAAMNGPRTLMTTGSPTTPSPVNVVPNRGPYKVSVIPQQQLQQQRPNPPKQTPQRPQGPLTQKINAPVVTVRQVAPNPVRYRHPAPLPNQPLQSSNPAWKLPPARPTIRISNLESGIVISWTIEDTAKEKYAESTSYQIYAYQETSGPPEVSSWRHVGDVKAMLLPMAVTLTQFQEGQRYYFAVRAVDAHKRCGPFSFAKTWS